MNLWRIFKNGNERGDGIVNNNPFIPPTDYYDDKVAKTDAKICALLQERKELSDNNPGFPTANFIANWAIDYGFTEEFLNTLFVHLFYEEVYKSIIEPQNFRKNIPILKGTDKESTFYSISMISQYENASKVYFNIIKMEEEDPSDWSGHTHFDLMIEGTDMIYECRTVGGSGSLGNVIYEYIVAPALPDQLDGIQFAFKEMSSPYKQTGLEVIF